MIHTTKWPNHSIFTHLILDVCVWVFPFVRLHVRFGIMFRYTLALIYVQLHAASTSSNFWRNWYFKRTFGGGYKLNFLNWWYNAYSFSTMILFNVKSAMSMGTPYSAVVLQISNYFEFLFWFSSISYKSAFFGIGKTWNFTLASMRLI